MESISQVLERMLVRAGLPVPPVLVEPGAQAAARPPTALEGRSVSVQRSGGGRSAEQGEQSAWR